MIDFNCCAVIYCEFINLVLYTKMIYITNRARSVNLPYEPELLEWLRENYPYSAYRIVDTNSEQSTELNKQKEAV